MLNYCSRSPALYLGLVAAHSLSLSACEFGDGKEPVDVPIWVEESGGPGVQLPTAMAVASDGSHIVAVSARLSDTNSDIILFKIPRSC